MEDFEPARVAQQVAPLRELMEIREKLRRLQTKVEMDPDLEGQVDELIRNTELRDKLNSERPQTSATDESAGGEDAPSADGDTGDES